MRKNRAASLEDKDQWYNRADAWHNKGAVLINLARYEEAIACFERAIELKPDYADAWHNKGVALEALGWQKEAHAAYERGPRTGGS